MATRRKLDSNRRTTRPPAATPESRENQLVAMAVDLAEKQLQEGTASSQVISHFLKLGSTRERLEQERLAQENLLVRAKIEDMASKKRIEELYETALSAMRTYAGQDSQDEEEFFDD